MSSPFLSMSAAEVETYVRAGREWFLSRASLSGPFMSMPRFEEAVDALIARRGESKAIATAHAALLFMNSRNMLVSLCKMTKAPMDVATSGAHSVLDFIVFQSGIDPIDLFTVLRLIDGDVDQIIDDMGKKK